MTENEHSRGEECHGPIDSRVILSLIANGSDYDQVIKQSSATTYFDVFTAVAAALKSSGVSASCPICGVPAVISATDEDEDEEYYDDYDEDDYEYDDPLDLHEDESHDDDEQDDNESAYVFVSKREPTEQSPYAEGDDPPESPEDWEDYVGETSDAMEIIHEDFSVRGFTYDEYDESLHDTAFGRIGKSFFKEKTGGLSKACVQVMSMIAHRHAFMQMAEYGVTRSHIRAAARELLGRLDSA